MRNHFIGFGSFNVELLMILLIVTGFVFHIAIDQQNSSSLKKEQQVIDQETVSSSPIKNSESTPKPQTTSNPEVTPENPARPITPYEFYGEEYYYSDKSPISASPGGEIPNKH